MHATLCSYPSLVRSPSSWHRHRRPSQAGDRAPTAPCATYARDTWRSMVAMTDPATGLVADNIAGDLATGTRSAYTSPTNIGGYMWSAVVARDLGIISRAEARARIGKTLDTLAGLEHHDRVRHVLQLVRPGRRLGGDGLAGGRQHRHPVPVQCGQRLARRRRCGSSRARCRSCAARPTGSCATMNFGFYFNPAATPPIGARGLIRGGFWDTAAARLLGAAGRRLVHLQPLRHHGDRAADRHLPRHRRRARSRPTAYFDTMRTLPDNCDYSWQEMQPVGFTTTHLGRAGVRGLLPLPRASSSCRAGAATCSRR